MSHGYALKGGTETSFWFTCSAVARKLKQNNKSIKLRSGKSIYLVNHKLFLFNIFCEGSYEKAEGSFP